MTRQGSIHDFDVDEESNPLSPAESEVFVAVEVEGLTPTEVAEKTGRAPSTVRTLLFRAREKRGER